VYCEDQEVNEATRKQRAIQSINTLHNPQSPRVFLGHQKGAGLEQTAAAKVYQGL
jgi:hypothetical protein